MHLQDLEIDGKIITTHVKRCENADWFHKTEDRTQCRGLQNTVMNLLTLLLVLATTQRSSLLKHVPALYYTELYTTGQTGLAKQSSFESTILHAWNDEQNTNAC